jgi:hypothetical protein
MRYMLQDGLAHAARAREFHTGGKPDEAGIRIARQVLEERIASFKTIDEMRDILYYIADKSGPLEPSACRTISRPRSVRIPEPVPHYQRTEGSPILCRSLLAREKQVAILLRVLNNVRRFRMLNIRY